MKNRPTSCPEMNDKLMSHEGAVEQDLPAADAAELDPAKTIEQFAAGTGTAPESVNIVSEPADVGGGKRRPYSPDDWRSAWSLATSILVVVMTYAIVRYVIAKGVSPEHLPLLIADKAIAFVAVAMIGASFACSSLRRRVRGPLRPSAGMRRTFGLVGFYFASLHCAINFVLLGPEYHASLFLPNGTMKWHGELSMLAGVLAAFILSALALTSLQAVQRTMSAQGWKRIHRVGLAGLALVGVHLVAMGASSWFTPAKWPAGLPPITLLSLSVITLVALLRLTTRSARKSQTNDRTKEQ